MAVTEKVKFRSPSLVEDGFHDLKDDEIFVEAAAQGIPGCLFGSADIEEESGQPGIGKVKFWRLNHPLPNIFKKRRQFKNDIRCFQDADPVFDSC